MRAWILFGVLAFLVFGVPLIDELYRFRIRRSPKGADGCGSAPDGNLPASNWQRAKHTSARKCSINLPGFAFTQRVTNFHSMERAPRPVAAVAHRPQVNISGLCKSAGIKRNETVRTKLYAQFELRLIDLTHV